MHALEEIKRRNEMAVADALSKKREQQLGVRGEGTAEDFPGYVVPVGALEAQDLELTPGKIVWNNQPAGNIEVLGAGDINSNERGSGARFNAGKRPLQYIPVEVWHAWLKGRLGGAQGVYPWNTVIETLAAWQRREASADDIMRWFYDWEVAEAAHVFDYGARKYASWNWAKGMDWSIPLACAMRHIEDILLKEEEVDPDSGYRHVGHVVCNVIMLVHYERYYPEGDDRPPREVFDSA